MRLTRKRDRMLTLHQAVKLRVGDGLVTDTSMPVFNR